MTATASAEIHTCIPLPTVTVETILSWHPCYGKEKTRQILSGKSEWSALDILDLDIPGADRIWAIAHDLLPTSIEEEFNLMCGQMSGKYASLAISKAARHMEICGHHDIATELKALPVIVDTITAVKARNAVWSAAFRLAARGDHKGQMMLNAAACAASAANDALTWSRIYDASNEMVIARVGQDLDLPMPSTARDEARAVQIDWLRVRLQRLG